MRRRKAKSNLIDFARYTFPGYIPSHHHYKIASKLEDVLEGKVKRLMIYMPPRHGKSELASRRFPAFFLGKHPERSIISASYNSDLSSDFGREVRNLVASKEYKHLFPDVSLAADSQSAGRWHTNKNGGYVSAGIGTSVTGRGAHIFLIDDPFKDRKDADSERQRDNVYKWYISTAYTRLENSLKEQDPDPLWRNQLDALDKGAEPFEGVVIIINTRWHEDDLCGRLLEDQKRGADQWDILSLPAINDQGEALWPNKYSIEVLKKIKIAMPSREWEALYQQEPAPDEGTFFKREWFKRFHLGEEPKVNKYQSDDYAVSDDKNCDFTEFGMWGLCPNRELWAVDWWYGKVTSDIWVNAKLDQIKKHKPYASFGESGVIRRAIDPYLKTTARKKKVYYRQEWITRSTNKVLCATAFQGMAASGLVHIPYTEWGERLIDQLCAFPAGKHDDAVDVCALIGMALDQEHEAILDNPKNKVKRDRWDKAFNNSSKGEWQTL